MTHDETPTLPAVPGAGALVRILFRLPPEERTGDTATVADDVYLLELGPAGFWYAPADDATMPYWTPWRRVEEISPARAAGGRF